MSLLNLTLDDTSPDIAYSSGWSTQAANDPNNALFFQSTYHVAQVAGATANITFNGSAIYLFGSKGPGHANYTVQFDNTLIMLSASAPETQMQQSLFAFNFGKETLHFVSLAAVHVGDAQWLDLDYVTIGQQTDLTTASAAQNSLTPPWQTISSTANMGTATAASSTSSTSSSPQSQISRSTNKTTLALSIVFGTLMAIILLAGIVVAVVYLRRRRQRRLHRAPTTEKSFIQASPGIPPRPDLAPSGLKPYINDAGHSAGHSGANSMLSDYTHAQTLAPSNAVYHTQKPPLQPARAADISEGEEKDTVPPMAAPVRPPRPSPADYVLNLVPDRYASREMRRKRDPDGDSSREDFLKMT